MDISYNSDGRIYDIFHSEYSQKMEPPQKYNTKRTQEQACYGETLYPLVPLFENSLNHSSTNSLPTFSNSKPHPLFTSNRHDKLHNDLNPITGHNHLGLLILIIHNLSHFTSNISRPHVKLRSVTRGEGSKGLMCAHAPIVLSIFTILQVNYISSS
ncbi:hypothetical protein YC2023_084549 [Brassica napus]